MRPGRYFEEGGYYHLGSRGNFKQAIAIDDTERRSWIDLLSYVSRGHDWLILSHCLMTNHYHLLVRAGRDDVSDAMQVLNGEFSRRMNSRHRRAGHLFENRFRAKPVKTERHLFATCAYIVLNPCEAGMCAEPGDWPWSSYRACIGESHAPSFLAVGELMRLFGTSPSAARRAYESFVRSRQGRVSDTIFWGPDG
ncbi:MAG: transposase [Gaiellaceae bacterium]